MFNDLVIALVGILIGAMLTHLYYDMKKAPESALDNSDEDYYDEFLTPEQKHDNAKRNLARVIAYPCPNGHAGIGDLCDTPGVWVCLERLNLAHDPTDHKSYSPYSYTREIGGTESLYSIEGPGRWNEVMIGDCRSGCKIYMNDETGERVLAHNSTYGCNK